MLLFAITGFTLNHAGDLSGTPAVTRQAMALPAPLLQSLAAEKSLTTKKPLPADMASWVSAHFPTEARGEAEWSEKEIYLPLARPGGNGWIAIDRQSGAVTSEITDLGWVAWLNDLHKGRDAGTVWGWFIDLFALASVIFAMTGLALLWLHSRRRPSTWPLVIGGLALPAILAVFFIHV